MPRPKTKTDLLDLSLKNYDALMHFMEALPLAEQEATFPEGMLNRNLKDVLMHLHHWHIMMLDWYTVGMRGEKPDMPAKGYTWKMTPELNRWIWEQYQHTPLAEAKAALQNSFQQVRSLIEKHTDEELFEKKRYLWTGSTSLGSYLISATSSHYAWALRLIKKVRKGMAE